MIIGAYLFTDLEQARLVAQFSSCPRCGADCKIQAVPGGYQVRCIEGHFNRSLVVSEPASTEARPQ